MAARREPVSRRDRPAKDPLSRAVVVAAAVRVMRAEGLERVTMRRLAGELDTGPASLYVYVDNMAELHGAVLDELLAELDFSGTDLVELLSRYTQVLFEYPSLARSVLTLRPSGANYLRLIDAVLGLLDASGVPVSRAAWGVDLLLQHATATAAEHGTRSESGLHDASVQEAALVAMDADRYPHVAGVGDLLWSGSGEQRLRWGFAVLIAGIAATAVP
ncbi:TetR/AcrR family transcriptional regulator C-terminal domain-containing protein [Winogradskya consettensis]|uniref:TetR family transcriptional regulator n=1 Tax=Winogradskya consettensis TaxID=113560 RepID=A0A919T0E6_9ACTN|nr:TetR/AcrR family transcriptional regulator C-terminal domain-containing protein [Actinoplanes consettensis]GIM80543.1 TetR family transcriptional regulator [Actinoplanes consettensis]